MVTSCDLDYLMRHTSEGIITNFHVLSHHFILLLIYFTITNLCGGHLYPALPNSCE